MNPGLFDLPARLSLAAPTFLGFSRVPALSTPSFRLFVEILLIAVNRTFFLPLCTHPLGLPKRDYRLFQNDRQN